MQVSKKLIIGIAATAAVVGGLGMAASRFVYADSESNYPPLVQKLIEKFNLSTTEVDKVIEEERTEMNARRQEMQQERQQEIEDKLNQAVTDGKITEAQKATILAKLAELRPAQNNEARMNFANLSDEERKAKMQERQQQMEQHRSEIEALETELGISIHDIIGFGMSGGFGAHGGRGQMGGMGR